MAKTKSTNRKVGGPFLAAAVFCENIVQDANGNKMSAIGIVDGCTIPFPSSTPPTDSRPITILQNVLITFRSGDSPGKHTLRLVIEDPNGKRTETLEKDIQLSKPKHGGCNLRTHAILKIHTSGIYWIDVYLDGKRFTRMPLSVEFAPIANTEKQSRRQRQ